MTMHSSLGRLASLLASVLLMACADDGSTDDEIGETGSGSESTSSESGTTSTGESDSSDASSTDADSSETDSGSTDADSSETDSTSETATDSSDSTTSDSTTTTTDTEGCVPIAPLEPIDHPGFSGSGNCEGVHENVVLDSQAAVDAHTDAYCTSLAMCIFPDPPCDPAPSLADSQMIVYAYAEGSGCSFAMNILSVEDCGTELVVTADFQQQGPCAVIGQAWDAVAIPSSAKPVQFVVQ
ncbi:hypothetical protein ACNOYE_26245 [Nannocystaceae bacterium ST9]